MYVVLRRCGDLPVYIVRSEAGEGPQRTLHRDLLLPCGFLPVIPVESEADITKAARQSRTRQHPKSDSSDEAGNESQSESESEEYHHDG